MIILHCLYFGHEISLGRKQNTLCLLCKSELYGTNQLGGVVVAWNVLSS